MSASDDYEFIVEEILESNADLVSLQEVTPLWDDVLTEALSEKYPHSKTINRFDLGIAVYSRLPFVSVDTFMCEDIPNILGTISLENANREVCFITSHA